MEDEDKYEKEINDILAEMLGEEVNSGRTLALIDEDETIEPASADSLKTFWELLGNNLPDYTTSVTSTSITSDSTSSTITYASRPQYYISTDTIATTIPRWYSTGSPIYKTEMDYIMEVREQPSSIDKDMKEILKNLVDGIKDCDTIPGVQPLSLDTDWDTFRKIKKFLEE